MNASLVIERARSGLREKYIWVLFPVIFAICFLNVNPAWATSQYRALVVLPLLLVYRSGDLRQMFSGREARWVLALFAWMTLTLAWDGVNQADWQILRKEIQVLAFFYLIYLQGRYRPDRTGLIVALLLLSGFVWTLLVFFDWIGFGGLDRGEAYRESARGVFSHHVYVGWMMAVLAISCLWQALYSGRFVAWCYAGFVYFALAALLVQSRGGYLVLFAGVLLVAAQAGPKKFLIPATGMTAVVAVLIGFFDDQALAIARNIIERGAAGRFSIWGNGFNEILESVPALVFGHGLSASSENTINGFVADHYHNFFVNLTFYAGVIGLAVYLRVVWCCVGNAVRQPTLRLWAVLLGAMQIGFMTDGESLFVNPSSILLCAILPVGMLAFRIDNSCRSEAVR